MKFLYNYNPKFRKRPEVPKAWKLLVLCLSTVLGLDLHDVEYKLPVLSHKHQGCTLRAYCVCTHPCSLVRKKWIWVRQTFNFTSYVYGLSSYVGNSIPPLTPCQRDGEFRLQLPLRGRIHNRPALFWSVGRSDCKSRQPVDLHSGKLADVKVPVIRSTCRHRP